jgi:outer membrane protein TolC
MKAAIILLCLLPGMLFAQRGLNYFLAKAADNSPALYEYHNLQSANQVQKKLIAAQNSAFQLSISGDYLFAPYFNNNGNLVSTNPSLDAFGYDIGVTNGGLYSAQINLERSIFNGRALKALNRQVQIQGETYQYDYDLEKQNLEKEVTDQYLNAYQFLLLSRLSDEVAANLRQQLKLTEELLEKGFVDSKDYLLLKIELQSRVIARNDTRQQYRSSLYQLYALCGIKDTTVVDLEDAELTSHEVNPQSKFIKKYELDSLASVNQQMIFETKYSPQVKLFANSGLNAVELKNIEHKFGMGAGLSVTVPILDGGQKSLTRQQNQIARNTIHAYRQYASLTIDMQRKNLKARIQSLEQSINALKGQIVDYRELLENSARQLRQGNISMIDYLTLLRNFIELRKNNIDMAISYQHEINNYNYWSW